MKDKILTKEIVSQKGWDILDIITADMLKDYTDIGKEAFSYCYFLISVRIPNSVKSIGDLAFYKCSNLKSIIIGNSVTSIGYSAFSDCCDLMSVTIGNHVTSIEEYAFARCYKLTSITIPDSVISIKDWAFECCSGLMSLTIGSSVEYIGGNAFFDCKCLISLTIPNSVTFIGAGAFSDCAMLTSITIPNSVIDTGGAVFYYCGFRFKIRYDEQGRLIAYKGFNSDMTCRDFQYKEGETYELEGEIKLCRWGFHACINPLDCLNHYFGEIGKDVVFHEVYLEDVFNKDSDTSKVVARKITIGREITLSEMADIASDRK